MGFIIIIISFKSMKNRLEKKDMHCNLKIVFYGKSIIVNAIIDTGNFLREPITKKPVVIVERSSLKDVVPAEILENLNDIINGTIAVPNEYASKIKIIPFSALGTDNGILLGIQPDDFIINYQEKSIENKNVIIGIYDKKLSKINQYQALVGLDIINKINKE